MTLTSAHLAKVPIIIKTMRLPYQLVEDAQQEGYVGLLQAAVRFNESNGAQFGTFADKRIRGAVRDFLRNMDYLSRDHRKAIKEGHELELTNVRLTQDLEDTIIAPDAQIEPKLMLVRLRQAVTALPERHRRVVQLRLQKLSYLKIGRVMGLSEARAYQLMVEALKMLQSILKEKKK